MKRLAVIAGALGLASQCWAGELLLAEGGRSDYVIVLAREASPSERHGAEELQRFLREMSGAELKIATDEEDLPAKAILLGANRHLDRIGARIDFAKLGQEGFAIRTVPPHVVIAGSRLRGTMYGVYAFLEDHLGCRWFTATVSRIPKTDRLAIPDMDDTQIPPLEYREPFSWGAFDPDWCARNKCNGNRPVMDEAHGGQIKYYTFVHTFERMIPPDKYFDQHPEYFSLIGGKRQRIRSQLCLTNPDVLELGIECVRQWMREHPEATVFSVSQNDWHGWCECDKCQAVSKREGSEIGPILEYVNQIADAVKAEFPDKIIDTLSYSYSQAPPKTIRPRPNVVVRLCSIRCCFAHPLATCDFEQSQKFRDDIAGWMKMCDRLWVWDYVTCFGHYIVPFPNIHAIKPNIQFFVQHHVKGIFEEGNYHSPGGYMAELRDYLMAKLLWNPDLDDKKLMKEFLEAYYGGAAPAMQRYVDLFHDKVTREDLHVTIGAHPDSDFLTDDLLDRAEALLTEAEAAVAQSPDALERVRACRIPLDYVRICRAMKKPPEKPASPVRYEIKGDRYTGGVDEALRPRVERFVAICDREKVTHVGEGQRSLYKFFKTKILDKALGYEIVSLTNEALKMDVVPGMEGRIIGLTLLSRNRNLSFVAKPTAARYPAAGGYEEWTGSLSPWQISRLCCDLKQAGGATQLKMWPEWQYIVYNDRLISLPNGNAKSFSLRTSLINKSPAVTPRLIGGEHCLDLGPPDDVTLAFAQGRPPVRLALPKDRIEGEFALSPEDVRQGIVLANHAQRIGLKWRVPQGEIASASVRANVRGPYVAITFRTPAGDLESNGKIADIVQEYEILEDVSAVAQAAPAPGTAPGAAHYSGEVVGEQEAFSLYKRGTHSDVAADPDAADGKCATMGGFHREWAVQWRWDAESFDPGEEYDVFVWVKVKKKGEAGLAFSSGVYDTVSKKGMGSVQRQAAEVENGKWMKVKIATEIPSNGMYVWAAPPENPNNIQEVLVDRFVVVRRNPPKEG